MMDITTCTILAMFAADSCMDIITLSAHPLLYSNHADIFSSLCALSSTPYISLFESYHSLVPYTIKKSSLYVHLPPAMHLVKAVIVYHLILHVMQHCYYIQTY